MFKEEDPAQQDGRPDTTPPICASSDLLPSDQYKERWVMIDRWKKFRRKYKRDAMFKIQVEYEQTLTGSNACDGGLGLINEVWYADGEKILMCIMDVTYADNVCTLCYKIKNCYLSVSKPEN
ncbi:hypothetical protein STEG23_001374, partial [Scotinomys teguina]